MILVINNNYCVTYYNNFRYIIVAGADFMSSRFILRFQPSDDAQTKCTKVGIISDSVIEPTEQFSVKLTSVSPEGTFIQDTSCISIIDDRKLSIAKFKSPQT